MATATRDGGEAVLPVHAAGRALAKPLGLFQRMLRETKAGEWAKALGLIA
jgi:hypothetical protein